MKKGFITFILLGLLLILSVPVFAGSAHPEEKQPLVQHLTQAEFIEKVFDYKKDSSLKYLGDRPAIVDFYADWCVPCQRLSPILEDLAQEYEGQIVIYKINTDKERALAGDFGITALPTMLFIPMEGDPQIQKGSMPKNNLKKLIENILLK
ncbi:MAG: thioredoxin fold domain-containing protein [Bacteroidales bacterium]|nr:thioredoxin fold domain-containing protein [Bacteroidales bacterium]